MAKPNKISTPSTHLSQYCNNSFDNMRHDYFGDVSFMEEKLQMYTNQFELTNSFSVGDNNKYHYSRSGQHMYTLEIWIFTGMTGRRCRENTRNLRTEAIRGNSQ
ncbi:hypothetical protein DY000_02024001 [Brassica cretica]|uniref:Uncharacterized protein n=1 Tax=Brassica cretica TaxID=69181 RepID=A0ABQ7EDC5_BRACR|nr:hypothetical protein DY000_02024001 [Brassica cretica]